MKAEFGIAQRPARGEKVCGDAYVIVPGAATVVALADGLGHGPLAAAAAVAFCQYVREHANEVPDRILRGSTEKVSHTRGAAAAVIRLDESNGTLVFAGIGNVELQALSQNAIRPVSTPGIVGRKLRKIVPFDYEVVAGDLLAMYSDGISSRFELKEFRSMEPQQIAEAILDQHGKQHDDATVIVFKVHK
jgi:serine/threonine protein phosphatase PrpC